MSDKDVRLKNRRKRKIQNILYVLMIFGFIIVFSWVGYAASYVYPLILGDLSGGASPNPMQNQSWDEGKITVLLLGSDRREGQDQSRSDTMMVLFMDTNTKTVRLVSIPRDAYVTIPSKGEKTKINHAYAFGGVDLSKATLKKNFGIDVDYYVDIDFNGFSQVIDALGGVTIDVPQKMYNADENIDLDPGLQKLDGNGALQFVRFREVTLGDLGRIERQQVFMKALKEQVMQAGNVLRIPDVAQAVTTNVHTDLTGGQVLKLINTFKSDINLETYQVPGDAHYEDGISYFFVSETKGPAFFQALAAYEAPSESNSGNTTGTVNAAAATDHEMEAQ